MYISADASSIEVNPSWSRADSATIQQLAEYPVALIGDVVSRIGMMTSAIRPQTGSVRLSGTVLPVLTREGDNLAIHRALDEAQPGDVLVIDAHAEENRAVFGDILGDIALSHGVTSAIVDGAIRDVDDLEALGFTVHARAVNPAGPAKIGPGRVGFPVAVGNVVCNPGDAIFADRDGIIVLPEDKLDTVLTAVIAQDEFENDLRQKIRANGAYGESPNSLVHN